MKQVYNIKATRTLAGPGVYGYDAEATVRLEDQTEVFVHVNEYDDMTHYTVGKESIYDEMTGNAELTEADVDEIMAWKDKLMAGEVEAEVHETKFIEEYSSLKEASASEYKDVFMVLTGTLSLLKTGIK